MSQYLSLSVCVYLKCICTYGKHMAFVGRFVIVMFTFFLRLVSPVRLRLKEYICMCVYVLLSYSLSAQAHNICETASSMLF